jgi:hypothetical protein
MPLIYGKGREKAFKWLREEIDKHLKAQQALFQKEKEDQEFI